MKKSCDTRNSIAGWATRGRVHYGSLGDGYETTLTPDNATRMDADPYDVAVVGAGVVGCALAFELSRYQLRVLLLDEHFDVGEGTSKGNSAIIHTGFDASPGTLESQLVAHASHRWPELAERLKIPFRQNGALLLALDNEQTQQLSKLKDKARTNGVDDVEIIGPDEVRRLEPNSSPTARGGLLVPRESIIDPFTVSIAFAEVAVTNGVDVLFGNRVVGVENAPETSKELVVADGSRISTRIVVNVAGLGSRRLTETYQGERFDINPRRGQFLIYDKNTGTLVERILLPVPTATTKGKLVTPTVFGNLLTGPTAEDLPLGDPDAASTTIEGLADVRESALRMCPKLAGHRPVATYAGARCNCAQGSYQIRLGDGGHPGILTVTGVRSTGLTSSPALAEHLVEQMQSAGWLTLTPDPDAIDARPERCWPGWWRRPFEKPEHVAAQPDYGRMICFCEQVSQQEIVDAVGSPLRPSTLDAVKRRTRAMMGRCQGFNCLVRNAELISQHGKALIESLTKHRPGSELLSRSDRAETMTRATKASISNHRPADRCRSRHVRVAIVGAGPAGIGAAIGLAKLRVGPVLLLDRWDKAGGIPAKYAVEPGGVRTYVAPSRGRILFGQQFADHLLRRLAHTDVELRLESTVLELDAERRVLTVVDPQRGNHRVSADAIVLATGAREETLVERGWIAGSRAGHVLQTMQLLELLGRGKRPAWGQAVVAGSDLIAYAAAAKLKGTGAQTVRMIDTSDKPQTPLLARWYFRRWVQPEWHPERAMILAATKSDDRTRQLRFQDGRQIPYDALVVSGQLVPNSELLVEAELATKQLTHIPLTGSRGQLSSAGCFAVGNLLGGFHGGQWCYRNGLRVAKSVGQFF